MRYILFLLVIFYLVGCQQDTLSWEAVNSEIEEKFSHVKHITIDKFIVEIDSDADMLIIDVRNPEEYAISHIPGAINITDPGIIAKMVESTGEKIVVYCSVGYRSAEIANKLQKIGINDVVNLQGSIFAWANDDLPLINKAGKTRDVHPYNEYWGKLLDERIPTAIDSIN